MSTVKADVIKINLLLIFCLHRQGWICYFKMSKQVDKARVKG